VPVVFIQVRLKALSKADLATDGTRSAEYLKLFRWWFLLGWPAFAGLLLVFFLMVLKPAC
jgi:uncharacterized membrane protein